MVTVFTGDVYGYNFNRQYSECRSTPQFIYETHMKEVVYNKLIRSIINACMQSSKYI